MSTIARVKPDAVAVAAVEVAREACNAFDPPLPTDTSIIGKVEKVNLAG